MEKELNTREGQTLEQRLESMPNDERLILEKSWATLKKMERDKRDNPKGVTFSKTEKGDPELVGQQAEEIHDFLAKFFDEEETTDPKQIEIGISAGIIDNYIARDEEGKMISLLQTQTMETLSEEGKPEISLLLWFIAQDKDFKGVTSRDLLSNCFEDLLKKSQDELKPVKALIGETVPEVEKLSNFYGLKRVYGKDKDGKTFEVPFEDPPEDESTEGVPEHLMIRLLNGENNISPKSLLSLVDGLYGQYTREEYSSPEYLQFLAEEEDDDSEQVTPEMAKMYRQGYAGITAEIREKLATALEATDGDLFFMTQKESNRDKTEK